MEFVEVDDLAFYSCSDRLCVQVPSTSNLTAMSAKINLPGRFPAFVYAHVRPGTCRALISLFQIIAGIFLSRRFGIDCWSVALNEVNERKKE